MKVPLGFDDEHPAAAPRGVHFETRAGWAARCALSARPHRISCRLWRWASPVPPGTIQKLLPPPSPHNRMSAPGLPANGPMAASNAEVTCDRVKVKLHGSGPPVVG